MTTLLMLATTAALAVDVNWFASIEGDTSSDLATGWDVVASGGAAWVGGDFDADLTVGGTTVTSFGLDDVYIAKYSGSGSPLGVFSFGSDNNDHMYGLAPHPDGGVVAIGTFVTPIDIDGTSYTTTGSADVWIVRLNASGSVVFAKTAGSPGYDYPYAVDVDPVGNIVVTGQFAGPANLDGLTSRHEGGRDAFVWKLDSNGNTLWVRTIGGAEDDIGRDVVVGPNNNVYVVGQYRATATTDDGDAVSSAGEEDIFVASLTPAGATRWLRSAGGPAEDRARALAIGNDTELFFAGEIDDDALFGTTTVAAPLVDTMYAAAVDPATGALAWVNGSGATGEVNGLTLVHSTLLVMSGAFTGPATFDTVSLTNQGGRDGYLVGVDAATGAYTKGVGFGGPGEDWFKRVYGEPGRNVFFATGTYSSEGAVFDQYTTSAFGPTDGVVMELPRAQFR